MSPSAGHLHKLVAKNYKLLRAAWKTTTRLIQKKLPASSEAYQAELQPVLARNSRQPIHPAAYLRQSKGRWYTTRSYVNNALRRFSTSGSSGAKYDRSSFPTSNIGRAVNALPGRAPFASTLRPSLTGGTLNRTAGGYAFGSGRAEARYFSHSPAAPAQVVQSVSQAVRSFLIAGQKAQFDGVSPRTGEKRYRAVTSLQSEVGRKLNGLPKATPGSFINFNINPTITALTPMGHVAGFSVSTQDKESLNAEGLLDGLSVDFSRALKELAMIINDIKRLSDLGDLPITYRPSSLRIHFPGCDAESVERLCMELGVQRGVVHQDEDFDAFAGTEIALLFPFASSKPTSEASCYAESPSKCPIQKEQIEWQHMISPDVASVGSDISTRSEFELEFEDVGENPWAASSPSGFESLHSSEIEDAEDFYGSGKVKGQGVEERQKTTPLEYQGFEGIWRFMEECDAASIRR